MKGFMLVVAFFGYLAFTAVAGFVDHAEATVKLHNMQSVVAMESVR